MATSNTTQAGLFGPEERLCGRCGKPLDTDGMQCKACRKDRAAYMRAWYPKIKASGNCHLCCKPLDGSGVTCKKCVQKGADRRLALKVECFIAYGGCVCACCKLDRLEFLSLDHINNNGAAERAAFRHLGDKTGHNFYRKLKKRGFPPGYQVLCYNCNCGRRINGGVCPHQSTENAHAAQRPSQEPRLP